MGQRERHHREAERKYTRTAKPPGSGCDNCGSQDGHELAATSAGKLCLRCAASWLSRGQLPPVRRP